MSIRFKLTLGGMLLTCVTILLTAGGYAVWLQAARQSLPAIPADAAEQLSREFLRVTAGLTLGLTVGAGALLLLFDMRMRRRMLKIAGKHSRCVPKLPEAWTNLLQNHLRRCLSP